MVQSTQLYSTSSFRISRIACFDGMFFPFCVCFRIGQTLFFSKKKTDKLQLEMALFITHHSSRTQLMISSLLNQHVWLWALALTVRGRSASLNFSVRHLVFVHALFGPSNLRADSCSICARFCSFCAGPCSPCAVPCSGRAAACSRRPCSRLVPALDVWSGNRRLVREHTGLFPKHLNKGLFATCLSTILFLCRNPKQNFWLKSTHIEPRDLQDKKYNTVIVWRLCKGGGGGGARRGEGGPRRGGGGARGGEGMQEEEGEEEEERTLSFSAGV